jgi:transposase-like protein
MRVFSELKILALLLLGVHLFSRVRTESIETRTRTAETAKKEFRTLAKPHSIHIRHIHFKRDMNNNKMERLNGEIRDREKTMRSLKKDDSPIITGMQIHHNYIRTHMGINNETPADKAGIKIEGNNKWITLIQNAKLNQ